ncbi:hypothetical protein [Sphingomonas sabuli]|uniref:hypothetical protein n=1 Tax=Sphingomonas sabuli TaxID=2764186 RepID=UPI001FE33557|nr:hypothetical protein [Sphingomonas sabuli]
MTAPSPPTAKENPVKLRLPSILALALLAGCSRQGNIEEGGIYTIRSACPQVAIPAGTGDMTVFDPAGATEASAIDIEAAITNVRTSCQESGDQIISTANFEVVATRRDPTQARQVVLPFFDAAVQAGEKVVAKRVSAVSLNFAPGSLRASTSAQATVRISRAVATLPEDVRKTLTRRRKVGDVDAAIDPLSDPTIRAAVARASFAHLVGFQLTDDQLRYNVTR